MTQDAAPSSPLKIGASWYPEMWPEEEWAADVARMRSLGFNVVRLFEFAWHRFEPQAGVYDFTWARRLLDLLHANGIAAMIGTPTAAPPAWLTSAHPEVLGTRADGRRQQHGKRKHYNHHSRLYRQLSAALIEALCQALADHPAIHSWQIDNEMSGFDYGPETTALFHAWLAQRYGTIDQLNAAWGLEFWSQAYDSFEQVPLCTAEVGSIEVPERHHPSLIMAIARFQNEAWTSFITEQCAIIRRHSRQPITTNMVGLVGAMDWFAHNREMDVVGASMYADRRYYHYNLARFDRLRAEKGYRPYWLLETAPNWSGGGRTFNIHYDERGVRLFSWLSVILGGEMVLYWQWREHWAGQEMLHGTCVTATGRWRPNREAWTRLAADFAAHGAWLAAHPPQQARLAVVMSSQASWAFSVDPSDDDMHYPNRFRDHVYLPLVQAQLWRDVIGEDADLAPYQVLCLPLLPIIRPQLRERLEAWVAAGGTLILGPLSGIRTPEFTIPTDQEFGGLERLIGATSALRFTVQWVEDRVQVVFDDQRRSPTKTLCEAYEPTGATVMARYQGGYGDGLPAVLDHRFGDGRVITIGGILDDQTWAGIVTQACQDAGLQAIAEAPPQVVIVPRVDDNGRVAGHAIANLSEEPQTITLPAPGRDLLSGHSIPATTTIQGFDVLLVQHDTA